MEYKIITLRNSMTVKVDSEDFDQLSKYSWGVINNKKHIYASRGTRVKGVYSKILMHRTLINCPKGMFVDHINGDTLDNRKSNLRVVSRAQNLQNSKLRADSKCKFKGVSRKGDKYIARIQIDVNKRLYLGKFETEIDAAEAYNKAAIEHFGQYARLNVIPK